MEAIVTIDVTSACTDWSRVCAHTERLARDTARLTLMRGMAAPGLTPTVPVELGIILADNAELRRLNRDYRGKDMPTNVLAFPAWEPGRPIPPGMPVLLDDVVLGFGIVAREAADQDKPFADHLRHLVVHGVLHLLGYDHLTHTEAVIMESLETSILATLGVPDPYRCTMWSVEPEPT